MANVSFNPALTTSATNSFLVQTEGYVQGCFVDDPSSYQYLTSGQIASTVTQPVWGGMAIQELVNALTPGVGSPILPATTEAQISGWTVFNQTFNAMITPGNSVPAAYANNTFNYFRRGSNARIQVQCTSAVVTAVATGQVDALTLYWDFTNQQLTTTAGTALVGVKVLSTNTNSKVVAYNSGTQALTWTTGSAAVIQI